MKMHQALQHVNIVRDVEAHIVEVDLPVGQHHFEELNLERSFIVWEHVVCSWKLGHKLVQMALTAAQYFDRVLVGLLGLRQHVLLVDQISVAEVVGDELVEGFVEPSNRIGLALMGVVPIGTLLPEVPGILSRSSPHC
jgi:hypothetical protein